MSKLGFSLPIIICVLLLFSTSCNKSGIPRNIPSCIRSEVLMYKNDPNAVVDMVDEYQFQGKIVYGFSSNRIADGSTEIKDGSCNTLCHVGGFGGPDIDMCNGEHFFQRAVLKRNIWRR